MDHDAAHRLFDAGGQFQQLCAQRSDLSAGQLGGFGLQSELLHEGIGGDGQQDAKLVGLEA